MIVQNVLKELKLFTGFEELIVEIRLLGRIYLPI